MKNTVLKFLTLGAALCGMSAWAGVAKIGETEYDTVSAAFSAATSGQVVVMTADAEEAGWMYSSGENRVTFYISDKNVGLDLNGHALSLPNSWIAIWGASGTLTVSDSSVGGTGRFLFGTHTYKIVTDGYVKDGALIVTGGTFNYDVTSSCASGYWTESTGGSYRVLAKPNVDDSFSRDASGAYVISTVDELRLFAKFVNSGTTFSGKKVVLGADLDLDSVEWSPIGTSGHSFRGAFDGQDHVVSNLKTSDSAANDVGFFGYVSNPASIRNLRLHNVDIKGNLDVGAVVGDGYTGGGIENCHVTGDIRINGCWYVGGIGGNGYISPIKNCSVEGKAGSAITMNTEPHGSAGYFGGIWGFRGEGANVIENCTVKNISVEADCNGVGGVVGILHYGNVVRNCTLENVMVTLHDLHDEGADFLGLIAGGNTGTKDSPGIVSGCTVTSSSAVCLKNGEEIAVKRQVGTRGSSTDRPYYQVTDNDGKIIEGRFPSVPSGAIADGLASEKESEDAWVIQPEVVPEPVSSVVASENVLAIKRVPGAGKDEVVAAVPWKALVATQDITVDKLIATGVANGDVIAAWDQAARKYRTWTYDAAAGAWTPATDAKTNVSDPAAVDYTLARGQAVWYTRKNPSAAYSEIGSYLSGTVTTATVAGGATPANKPVNNLLVNPFYQAVDLTKIPGASGDQIQTLHDMRVYTNKGGQWGTNKLVTTESPFGPVKQPQFDAATGPVVVPAGQGFWYISKGGAPAIDWKAIKAGAQEPAPAS